MGPLPPSAAPWWGEYLAQYKEAAPYVLGAKVLDIGCGAGFGTRYLFDHGAVEAIGVDINNDDIVRAQKDNGRDGVSFVVGDGKTLPFPAKSFDAITCFQVLESSISADGILEQMKRLLVPGGKALITTVNRKRASHEAISPLDAKHIQEFTLEELRLLLKMNFSDCEIYGLACKRPDLLERLPQNKTLEFVKDQLENRIPWKVREIVAQRLFGVSYYPAESDYALTSQNVEKAHLFFAVCR